MARSTFRLPHLSIIVLLFMSFWFTPATTTCKDCCLSAQGWLSWFCFGVCPPVEKALVYDTKSGTEVKGKTYLELARLEKLKNKARCCDCKCSPIKMFLVVAPIILSVAASLHSIEQENASTVPTGPTEVTAATRIVTKHGLTGTYIEIVEQTIGSTEWVYASDVISRMFSEYGWIIAIEFFIIAFGASVYVATRICQKKKIARGRAGGGRKSSSSTNKSTTRGGVSGVDSKADHETAKQAKKPKKASRVTLANFAQSLISPFASWHEADSKVESDDDDNDIEAARKEDKKKDKKRHHAKSPKLGRNKS